MNKTRFLKSKKRTYLYFNINKDENVNTSYKHTSYIQRSSDLESLFQLPNPTGTAGREGEGVHHHLKFLRHGPQHDVAVLLLAKCSCMPEKVSIPTRLSSSQALSHLDLLDILLMPLLSPHVQDEHNLALVVPGSSWLSEVLGHRAYGVLYSRVVQGLTR